MYLMHNGSVPPLRINMAPKLLLSLVSPPSWQTILSGGGSYNRHALLNTICFTHFDLLSMKVPPPPAKIFCMKPCWGYKYVCVCVCVCVLYSSGSCTPRPTFRTPLGLRIAIIHTSILGTFREWELESWNRKMNLWFVNLLLQHHLTQLLYTGGTF